MHSLEIFKKRLIESIQTKVTYTRVQKLKIKIKENEILRKALCLKYAKPYITKLTQ